MSTDALAVGSVAAVLVVLGLMWALKARRLDSLRRAKSVDTKPGRYGVSILPMSQNTEDEILVVGFPTLESARLYARRYTWSSVEEMKTVEKPETAFSFYGEIAKVLGDEYSGRSELDLFFRETPPPEDVDWASLERMYDVKKTYGE